jgi:hypothetical protein
MACAGRILGRNHGRRRVEAVEDEGSTVFFLPLAG